MLVGKKLKEKPSRNPKYWKILSKLCIWLSFFKFYDLYVTFVSLLQLAVSGTIRPLLFYADACKDTFVILTLSLALGGNLKEILYHITEYSLTFTSVVSIISVLKFISKCTSNAGVYSNV